ncbi:restriction modification system DNA specificity domain-containing protein [Geobacillus kaustophilus GBlys]|uniref:Restriction modification system DNA specificity domain-containing protein n=1 Tax=Geobacillus kaustophilus GBlys TaxID=1337888 RepID=U2Y2M4_GEOKU|nr:restriction modification system DNA specificity domain-containing protein [Geobacillus kaustophilus GBlys]
MAAEEKLDLVKQSVLQKAFRGELGTNDPNDGHAMELVKEALLSSSGQR